MLVLLVSYPLVLPRYNPVEGNNMFFWNFSTIYQTRQCHKPEIQKRIFTAAEFPSRLQSYCS
jgi:hypothetical protein